MKIPSPKIEVVQIRKEWKVEFSIGNQTFELAYGGTKSEANWMKRMLEKAFNSLTKEK